MDERRRTPWEHRMETPLTLASLLFLASYAVRVLGHGLPDAVRDACLAVTSAAWAVFALDFAVRWRHSGKGLSFVRHHWLDAVVTMLPLLRPLQVVRTYDAVRRRHEEPRLSLHARVATYAGMSATLLGFAAALAVYQVERGQPHATIRTFGDSVWWACSTLATVGYGDVVPVTPLGRLVAVALMGCGVALLGAITGAFSSWMFQVFRRDDERPPGDFPGAS
ncbi:potassium channel family protein [Streptomyces sp. NPDC056121]|uniref:potassium channel family protein n=1 Tax=Streptomyces TaxID=1883 RepID=UPI001D0A9285|nr:MULTISPECIES: potassium channel family protein [Streptomyces]MCX5080478.1 potassium channel family protein [Streptomyces sp. NBC_00401]UDL98717.1 potassium channel family protein [Streptomyces longhuiensis]